MMYLFKSEDHSNRLLYAYYKGEFWFYDPTVQQWYISGHVREQYELEAQKDVSLTPDDFTCTGYGYEFVAEYEVPVSVLDALRTAKKVLPPEPASAEPPEIVDEGSEPEDGFPGWVRPMVEAFLQFPFFRELPAFTAFAIRHSEPVQHHQGGSLADGVYDTGPKGIKFFVFRGDNSDQYREASYTWAGFVRRCKAAGLVPEPPRQDKEDAPCKTETPAPTGAAAATTDASAAPMPSTAAETTTTSESGAGAVTSTRRLSGSIGPSTSPAPASRADAGAAAQSLSAAGPASLEAPPSGSSAFDYTELDDQTVAVLHLAEREIREARQTYICRVSAAVASAHDELVANCEGHNQHSDDTFIAWCRFVGIRKDTAYRLLQVNNLLTGATAEEQATLEAASPSLLYAAAKPSAPAELVQAVKAGDITTHKQYQELLTKYNAEKAARDAADQRAEEEERKRKDAQRKLERERAANESSSALLADEQQRRQQANEARIAAENRAAGAQKLADQRATENAELKAKLRALESRPVEVAVTQPGAEQIEAWRKEGEARILSRAKDLAGKARQAQQQAECHASDLEEENNRLRDALNRTRQLDQSAAMACGTCSAALEAWFETTARDVPADLGPALTRMKRLRLALDIAIENGVWPDAAALDDLEAQDDDG